MDKFPSRERSATTALEPRVSTIVVVRGVQVAGASQSALDLCLRSVLAEAWNDELIIVDNGNPPQISAALRSLQADRRDVKVVHAPTVTLAGAANVGVGEARGRWIMFLDPDVVLQRGAIARMAAAGGEAHPPWIVGGRLTDTAGRDRRVARGGALNTFSALAVALDLPPRKEQRRRKRSAASAPAASVAAVSGAFMLMPRADFETLGGFDESFATDGADLDLCRRTAEAGGSVWLQPAAAGVQVVRSRRRGRRLAQGLARFAAKSAKTPFERAFAVIAAPTLFLLLALKEIVAGSPPARR